MAGDSNEGDGRKPDSQLALQIHSLLKNAEEALEEGNLVKARPSNPSDIGWLVVFDKLLWFVERPTSIDRGFDVESDVPLVDS